jgi:hypothetical protein
MSGYLAAHLAIGLITGVPPPRPGTIQGINLAAVDAPFSCTQRRRADCPGCAGWP